MTVLTQPMIGWLAKRLGLAIRDASWAALVSGCLTIVGCLGIPDATLSQALPALGASSGVPLWVIRYALLGTWILSTAQFVIAVTAMSAVIRVVAPLFARVGISAMDFVADKLPPVPSRVTRALSAARRMAPAAFFATAFIVAVCQRPDAWLGFVTSLASSPSIWGGGVLVIGFVLWGRYIKAAEEKRRLAANTEQGDAE